MTGTALTNWNDDWPNRPSLTPSHTKTPVSPRPLCRIAHRRQRRHNVGGASRAAEAGVVRQIRAKEAPSDLSACSARTART